MVSQPKTVSRSKTVSQSKSVSRRASLSRRKSVSKREAISPRKLEANRRNAKKSTGPKTPRGKRASSRNALKHGLMSQAFPLLPYENELEYRAVADAMQRDLAPVGILQREIVTHITQICWKLRRIPAIEAALLDYDVTDLERTHDRLKQEGEIDKDAPMPKATAAIVLAGHFARDDDRPYERLEMYRVRLERGLHAALRQLKNLRSETAGQEIDEVNGLLNELTDQVWMQQKFIAMVREDEEEDKKSAEAKKKQDEKSKQEAERAARIEDQAPPTPAQHDEKPLLGPTSHPNVTLHPAENPISPIEPTVSANPRPHNDVRACGSHRNDAAGYVETKINDERAPVGMEAGVEPKFLHDPTVTHERVRASNVEHLIDGRSGDRISP